ncbi:MAG: PilZ domain-containing protein [Propionivibrio sp.]
MRHFIRHPAEIPIEINAGGALVHGPHRANNLGLGGLAFHWEHEVDPGSVIALSIPVVRPVFSTSARVVWCRAGQFGYELGVEFLDPEDAFRARMVEQVCHIEEYRQAVLRDEGRPIAAEEAAMEWIEKHAAEFPSTGSGGVH